MAEIANSVPNIGPRETIVLANGKGVAGAVPYSPQGLGFQYVYGGQYSYFVALPVGGASVQLQINIARPGDAPIWVNVGAAKTATDTGGTVILLGSLAQVRVVITGTDATTDLYVTLTRIPA